MPTRYIHNEIHELYCYCDLNHITLLKGRQGYKIYDIQFKDRYELFLDKDELVIYDLKTKTKIPLPNQEFDLFKLMNKIDKLSILI